MSEDFQELSAKISFAFACTLAELLERKGIISASEISEALGGTANEIAEQWPDISDGLRGIAESWARGERRWLH